MQLHGLKALRLCAWLLWGVALLALASDLAAWWLAGGRGFPQLLASLGLAVSGNAVEHARRLLALQAGELAELRAGAARSRP
jgi:hypothetical protein